MSDEIDTALADLWEESLDESFEGVDTSVREEQEAKRKLAHFERLIDAEKNPSGPRAAKLEQAQARLKATQKRYAAFKASPLALNNPVVEPKSFFDEHKTKLIGGAVVAAVGFFAWKRMKK